MKKNKKKKATRTGCYIIWVDSEYVEVDQHDIDKDPISTIHTMGWMILDTKTYYMVAQEIHPETGWHRRTTKIPKLCVKHHETWEVEID